MHESTVKESNNETTCLQFLYPLQTHEIPWMVVEYAIHEAPDVVVMLNFPHTHQKRD